jgi:hypothetical protein
VHTLQNTFDFVPHLGLNLKNTGIFSKGLRTPWFGMAVISEVMTLVLPLGFSPCVFWSARASFVLRVKSTPCHSEIMNHDIIYMCYIFCCYNAFYRCKPRLKCRLSFQKGRETCSGFRRWMFFDMACNKYSKFAITKTSLFIYDLHTGRKRDLHGWHHYIPAIWYRINLSFILFSFRKKYKLPFLVQ